MTRAMAARCVDLLRSYPMHHQLEVFLGVPFVTARRSLSVWAFTIYVGAVDMHREGPR